MNGNQPNRGLSIDTRGTPIATAFNIGANVNQTPGGTLLTGLTLTLPNGTNGAAGGINILDLPGGAGCESMDGGMAYDEVLWAVPTAQYACAWDTGRAAVIQQPIETLTYYARGVVRISGDHMVVARSHRVGCGFAQELLRQSVHAPAPRPCPGPIRATR